MATASVTDGRTARSQRTRTAVVDALLALLSEGNPRPTAREIADKAGVSLRSVYVHFDDLEDLFVAASERQLEVVADLVVEVPASGPLVERARALMQVRGAIFEKIGPIRRAAERQEPFSPSIARLLRAVRKIAREELSRVFADVLDQTPDRESTLVMLDALSSMSTWDHLRTGLDVDDARRAVVRAMVSLLEHVEYVEPLDR